jgi:predicted ester cyclase
MPESRIQTRELMNSVYERMWNAADPAAARTLFERPAGVESFVERFLAAFPDLQHTVEEMLIEGDRVVVRFSASGTQRGEWNGIAPTQRRVSYTGVTLARIRDGRIAEHHTWWDTAELLDQIR